MINFPGALFISGESVLIFIFTVQTGVKKIPYLKREIRKKCNFSSMNPLGEKKRTEIENPSKKRLQGTEAKLKAGDFFTRFWYIITEHFEIQGRMRDRKSSTLHSIPSHAAFIPATFPVTRAEVMLYPPVYP